MREDIYNLTQGEDFSITVSLRNADGSAYAGAEGGGIDAYLVDRKFEGTALPAATQVDTGSTWKSGLVTVEFTDVDTSGFSVGKYYLRLDITEADGDIRKVIITDKVFQVWSVS